MNGIINSFQSLGAVDGPGLRYVVFMQGCNLRCKYCHNPETWDTVGESYSSEQVYNKIIRYKNYIKDSGGVTFSGGEPLMQAEFLIELSKLLKKDDIHIALDTNGSIINDSTIKLLKIIDLILLDIKMTANSLYSEYAGMLYDKAIEFLNLAEGLNKDVWVRQVIIENVNDTEENINKLKKIKKNYSCIKKIELLPFRKLCLEKYEKMDMEFPMKNIAETSENTIVKMKNKLSH